ncbi:MAG: hypothetical protein ABI041_15590, partial [Bdellovibrionia bacterium]
MKNQLKTGEPGINIRCRKTAYLLIGYLFLGASLHAADSLNDADSKLDLPDLLKLDLLGLLEIKSSVASKKEETFSNAAGIVSIVKMESVKSFGARTLKEALALIPG